MSILRQGDRGEAVRALQEQLNRFGADLRADGIFGPATHAAVKAFQRKQDLVVDGLAGEKTRAALDLDPDINHKILGQADIDKAARELGVDVPAVMAVNEVESRGRGFLPGPDGRPVILFERHIMRRRLIVRGQNVHPAERSHPDLVNATPGGYQGGAAEHDRLDRAKVLHRDAALESASWGLFQIMGFHWQRLGYASVIAMTQQMARSEGQQLQAFVRFVRSDKALHKALREHDWRAFARRYNGPAFERNRYDERMAEAHARYTAEARDEAAAA